MSRPRKIDVHFDRMDEVAKLVAQIPVYKCLAAELGMNENYLNNLMAKLVRIRRTGIPVSRETLISSLCSEQKFSQLMWLLDRKKAGSSGLNFQVNQASSAISEIKW